jgi:hypothetical protein
MGSATGAERVADNTKKTFLGKSLNAIARDKVADAIVLQGKALPCQVVSKKGSIVQVKFKVSLSGPPLPNVTIPHFGPQWARWPTQANDLGVTIAADAQLGGISGLGGGIPTLAPPSNLTGLYFMPLGNANWSVVDPNALVLNGPNGVVLQDTGGACTFTLTPSGIVIVIGGMTMTINTSGITMTGGDMKADAISLKTHLTSQVTSGSANSGLPVA